MIDGCDEGLPLGNLDDEGPEVGDPNCAVVRLKLGWNESFLVVFDEGCIEGLIVG